MSISTRCLAWTDGSSRIEFYDWLIRVTSLIRAQKEPQEQELFEIFVKELGQVLQFDHLAKYDAAVDKFSCMPAPSSKNRTKN